MRNKSIKYMSGTGIAVAVFTAILVIIYMIVLNHPKVYDLTLSGKNTLDVKTRNILDSLDFDVKVLVFCKNDNTREKAKDILDLFAYASKHVNYEIIDPDVHPSEAKKYAIERYGQAVLVGNGKQQRIDMVSEQNLDSAILKLKMSGKKTIYFTMGHGERDIEDNNKDGLATLKNALESDNYRVEKLILMREKSVPLDAGLVAVIGPKKQFLPEEIKELDEYIKQGGNLFVALDPMEDTGLEGLLSEYGVVLGNDMIIDKFSRILGGDYLIPVVSEYGDVDALRGFRYATFFPTACSLSIKKTLPKGIEIRWLARTSSQSWAETDLDRLERQGKAQLDKKDKKGPVDIGLFLKKKLDTKGGGYARLIIFGDSDFLSNTYIMTSGNEDLAMNCMNMLLGERELVVIKKRKANHLTPLTPYQASLMFWVPVVAIPCVILFIGISVFLVRRRA